MNQYASNSKEGAAMAKPRAHDVASIWKIYNEILKIFLVLQ
jgi:hypothetical protein